MLNGLPVYMVRTARERHKLEQQVANDARMRVHLHRPTKPDYSMRTHTLRNMIGIFVAAALLSAYAMLGLMRATSPAPSVVMTLAEATQMLKVAQTEKFQTDLQFAESNADAARLVGNLVRLGRIENADPVFEVNVRAGGIIEYLLDKKDSGGNPLRVIYIPEVGDPVGSQPIVWRCYSPNWSGVKTIGSQCRYDASAAEIEQRHVLSLRAAAARTEQDAEVSRAKYESDRVRGDFERQRAELERESERARDEEERQLARIERETERARIEYERQKRGG